MAFQACIQVCPKNPANFNVDNVRVAKLVGGGLHNSSVVRGLVLKNDAVGSIKKVQKAKVSSKLYTMLMVCFCRLSVCICFTYNNAIFLCISSSHIVEY